MARLRIDLEKCNRDGICVAECPALVLAEGEDGYPLPTQDFEEMCLKCGHCVVVCPTDAFALSWLSPGDCPPIQKEMRLSPEQAEQFLRSRRSIRVFKDELVDRALLERLIQIGSCAPSAKNMQPWKWIVIYDPAEVKKLDRLIVDWMRAFIQADPAGAETLKLPRIVHLWEKGRYKTLRNAPHLFIVHVDKNWGFGVEDTALALSYVELFSTSLGLGATWSGYFYTAYNLYPPLAEAVPVPAGRKVVGAMMVGHPAFQYHRMPRRKPTKIEWR